MGVDDNLGFSQAANLLDEAEVAAMLGTVSTAFHKICLQVGITKDFLQGYMVGGVGDKANRTAFIQSTYSQGVRSDRFYRAAEFKEGREPKLTQMRNKAGFSQYLFGGHKLSGEYNRPVCVTVDEPSAVIGAFFYPSYDWVSVCGQAASNMTDERLEQLISANQFDSQALILVRSGNMTSMNALERKLKDRKTEEYKVFDLWPGREAEGTFFDFLLKCKSEGEPLPDISHHLRDSNLKEQKFQQLLKKLPNGIDKDQFERFGFYSQANKYYIPDMAAMAFKEISNFIINPIFHIQGRDSSQRLVEIINENNLKELINLDTGTFNSLKDFKTAVEDKGVFLFWGNAALLDRVKRKIYQDFVTAIEVDNIGWQPEGFWAWSNGLSGTVAGQDFLPFDEFGITQYPQGKHWFVPAASEALKPKREAMEDHYADDRLFKYVKSRFTWASFSAEYSQIFGEKGNVVLVFLACTVFRDLVRKYSGGGWPMLMLAGAPGTGKSRAARAIVTVYGTPAPQFMLNSGTEVAWKRTPMQFRHYIAHLDEFKNDINPDRFEDLKNFYDSSGRPTGKKSQDNRTFKPKIENSFMVTGEHYPTNTALFTRMILLQYKTDSFDSEAVRRCDEFMEETAEGCSNVLAELLRWRGKVAERFKGIYQDTNRGLKEKQAYKAAVGDTKVISRIYENYCMLIAMARVLENILPFKASEFEAYCIRLLSTQAKMVNEGQDVHEFFSMLEYLLGIGEISVGLDYEIERPNTLEVDKTNDGGAFTYSLEGKTEVLYLRLVRTIPKFQEHFRRQNNKSALGKSTLKSYLQGHEAYLGHKKAHVFNTKDRINTSCYCFDYGRLGINLLPNSYDNTSSKDE